MKVFLLAIMAAASTMALEVKTLFIDVDVLRRNGVMVAPTTGNQVWIIAKSKKSDAAMSVKVVAEGDSRVVICSAVERNQKGAAVVCVADIASAQLGGAEITVEE